MFVYSVYVYILGKGKGWRYFRYNYTELQTREEGISLYYTLVSIAS